MLLRLATTAIARNAQPVRAKIGAMALAAEPVPGAGSPRHHLRKPLGRRQVVPPAAALLLGPRRSRPTTVNLSCSIAAPVGITMVGRGGCEAVPCPACGRPITINGRRYIDGGVQPPARRPMWTSTSCRLRPELWYWRRLRRLFAAKARVGSTGGGLPPAPVPSMIEADTRRPDQAIGRNLLDAGRRAPARLRAGRAQAAGVVTGTVPAAVEGTETASHRGADGRLRLSLAREDPSGDHGLSGDPRRCGTNPAGPDDYFAR